MLTMKIIRFEGEINATKNPNKQNGYMQLIGQFILKNYSKYMAAIAHMIGRNIRTIPIVLVVALS